MKVETLIWTFYYNMAIGLHNILYKLNYQQVSQF